MKKILICIFTIFLCSCSYEENIETIIEENDNFKVSINYPTFNIKKLDKKIKNDVLNIYNSFKTSNIKEKELNIDYKYNIKENIIGINLLIDDSTKKYNNTYFFDKNTNSFTSNKIDLKNESSNSNNETINIVNSNIDYNKKVIALTFDDGPSKYTKEIVDILNKNNVKATFFILGNKVNTYLNTLKYVIDSGNEIGNHSYNHKWLIKLDEKELLKQINDTQKIIKDRLGITPSIIRPTYGSVNNTLKNITDLNIILWDVDSKDWKLKNSKKIVKKIMNEVSDGDIILMHDTYKWSKDSLKSLIPKLLDEGYNFVTVSELLKIKLYHNLNEE